MRQSSQHHLSSDLTFLVSNVASTAAAATPYLLNISYALSSLLSSYNISASSISATIAGTSSSQRINYLMLIAFSEFFFFFVIIVGAFLIWACKRCFEICECWILNGWRKIRLRQRQRQYISSSNVNSWSIWSVLNGWSKAHHNSHLSCKDTKLLLSRIYCEAPDDVFEFIVSKLLSGDRGSDARALDYFSQASKRCREVLKVCQARRMNVQAPRGPSGIGRFKEHRCGFVMISIDPHQLPASAAEEI